MPYNKGDILTIDITDMGIGGEGIGKMDGYTLFVKDAVIGDKVKVSIMKAKKNYAYAHLDEVLIPSADRITPPCPKAKACGGCSLQALAYPAQLKHKQDKVRNDLIRIGGFDADYIDGILKDIVGMDNPIRYRGKAQFPVGRDRDGNVITGFYASHSHNIIPIDDCIIGAAEYAGIMQIIKDHMKRFDIAPYDEASCTGLIRHVLIRKGYATGQIMVCLILNRGKASDKAGAKPMYLTGQDELIGKLTRITGMTSVSVNLNTDRTNVIIGDVTVTIWGEDKISDVITPDDSDGITYAISPKSFYQVNPVQTDKLYSLALKYAHLTGKEIVWDLYCGIGTISLFLSGKAGHVYGVEIIPEAVKDAKANAVSNGIANATFYTGKAEDIKLSDDRNVSKDHGELSEDAEIVLPRPDVIVIDPPRKGCDEVLIDTILKAKPLRIVYVSCDPATLSRDLKLLTAGGYKLDEVTPVDMFPHSIHCECAVALHRE